MMRIQELKVEAVEVETRVLLPVAIGRLQPKEFILRHFQIHLFPSCHQAEMLICPQSQAQENQILCWINFLP